MIKATIILGEGAVNHYNETGTLPTDQWLMDNGGVVDEKEFQTKGEYDAYVQALSDASGWGDYQVIRPSEPEIESEQSVETSVWMRLGASLLGSKEEIGKVLQGDETTLIQLLQERKFNIDGESYIPQSCIESYNNENGTDFEEGDVNFYSLDIAVNNQPQGRIYMTPQEQAKQLTDKIVASLCHVTEYPDCWLPHSVWVEEVDDTGDPTYRHYMLEKIRPDGTCDLYNPNTGKLEHDDCHLSEINIDWLVVLWNRYIELCIDQDMWKDHAVEVLQEHFDVAEMTIREFVDDHWQNLLLDEDNIEAFKQWVVTDY